MVAISQKPTAAHHKPPRMVDVSPKYSALIKRRDVLGAELSDLNQRLFQLAEQASGQRYTSAQAEHGENSEAVRALLGDCAPARKVAPKVDNASETYQAALKRKRDIEQALIVLQREIRRESFAASVLVWDVAGAPYRRLMTDLCQSIIAAHKACESFTEFVDALSYDEVAFIDETLIWPEFLGSPRDKWDRLAQFLFKAQEAGYIKPSEIPEAFR